MKIFEVLMVVCFGFAWPSSLLKSWRAKSAAGKSIVFLTAILAGYLSGMIYKFWTGWDWASWFYLFNFLMVSADAALYFRNRALDRKRASPLR